MRSNLTELPNDLPIPIDEGKTAFPILSDHQHQLTDKLNLPTFDFEGERLIKRMAEIINFARSF